MKPFKYTDEQREFLKEMIPGRYIDEVADLFYERFGIRLRYKQISGFKKNHKIKSGVKPTPRSHPNMLFNEEQKEFIRKHVKGRYNSELAQLVNETFGLSITTNQIKAYKNRHGLSSGLDGCFKKGHDPWNKGKTGIVMGGRWRETQFKKGQRPPNWKPIGSERVCNKDGYIMVKVSNTGPFKDRWQLKHRLVWEKANGPIPENHAIIFADLDRTNCDIDNLILVPRSILARINQNNLKFDDPELTKTGVQIAELLSKIGEKSKRKAQ